MPLPLIEGGQGRSPASLRSGAKHLTFLLCLLLATALLLWCCS